MRPALGLLLLLAAPTVTVDVKEWPVPFKGHPRDPFPDAAGRIWFVGQEGHYLGRFDPKTGKFDKTPLDDGAGPHDLVIDGAGHVWFSGNLKGWAVETSPQPNVLVGFDPKTGESFARAPFPSGAGTVRNMVFDRGTRQIWFGTDHDTIGRAMVP